MSSGAAPSYVAPMTEHLLTQELDEALAERLATGLNRCFETFVDDEHVLAEDVFCDLLPPFWRFQLQGRQPLLDQLRAITPEGSTARILRVVPTATGFVFEHEHTQSGDGTVEVARRLHLCEVRDGKVAEVVTYCNGGWDDDRRARHAAEAPMVRP